MGSSGSKAGNEGTLKPNDQKVRSLAEWQAMDPQIAKFKAEQAKRIEHDNNIHKMIGIVILVLVLLVAAKLVKNALTK